jgi:K+-transporting ATPase KdpF subunit
MLLLQRWVYKVRRVDPAQGFHPSPALPLSSPFPPARARHFRRIVFLHRFYIAPGTFFTELTVGPLSFRPSLEQEAPWTSSGLHYSGRCFSRLSDSRSVATGSCRGGDTMTAIYVIGTIVAVLIFGYLVYALIKAEDF